MFQLPILLITLFSVLGNFIVYSSLPLGPYKISDVTISGFSSGGFLTVQVHVAYSSVFKAAAVFAGVSHIYFGFVLADNMIFIGPLLLHSS
jgi:predicted esterase